MYRVVLAGRGFILALRVAARGRTRTEVCGTAKFNIARAKRRSGNTAVVRLDYRRVGREASINHVHVHGLLFNAQTAALKSVNVPILPFGYLVE